MPSRPSSRTRDASTDSRARTADWVYSGLSVPERVVVARPSEKVRLEPGSVVSLVGDEHALGVAQFLGKIAVTRKVGLRFEWQRGQTFEHWFTPDKLERALARKPSLLLLLFDTKLKSPETLSDKAMELKRLCGMTPVRWILPFGSDASSPLRLALASVGFGTLRSDDVPIHRSQTGAPSARGYAGWAGAIWGAIR